MIETKKDLLLCIHLELSIYSEYMFDSKSRYFMSRVKREPSRMIYSFLLLSRKTDFYFLAQKSGSFLTKVLYLFYISKKNRLGEKLGLEIETTNIKPGLLIYHYNIVINGNSHLGKNCHLHGNNCIGNDGKSNECPAIGDNVSLGVGAVVIGNVTIANNIKIAAGAVVVHSFLEEGITIGGIPAKKIK
ncbi:serine acetyltransferase [Flavobacterium sp. LT1R49]|uniref:serine acetyltransferase n=1 Tax=Flavobacterium arabinosi TaxID=3398737 RepID=UPI003A8574BF